MDPDPLVAPSLNVSPTGEYPSMFALIELLVAVAVPTYCTPSARTK
jgi:hypothetical protein